MSSERVIKFLPQTRLGKSLSPAQLAEVAEIAEDVELGAGEMLFEAGEPPDGFYLLEEGEVAVVGTDKKGDEHVIVNLTAPSVIGEMELLNEAARYAAVRGVKPCRLSRFDQKGFHGLLDADSVAALKITRVFAEVLAERLRYMDRRFMELVSPQQLEELAVFKRKLLSEWSF